MSILMELEFAFNLYLFQTSTVIGLVSVLQLIQVEVSLIDSRKIKNALLEQYKIIRLLFHLKLKKSKDKI